MSVSITSQPSGINRINRCAVWGLNITGVIDETKDERGLYRLMSDDGQVTDWVSMPPIGNVNINFSKEISGALETPIPGFTNKMDATSMKKKFWLEYGDISYDKENCTKTENLGNQSSKSDFVNARLNGGQEDDFSLFTMRPDYMEVPRYEYYDFIYSDAGQIAFQIKLCTGITHTTAISGSGDITAYGVGTSNSPVSAYIDDVVYYDVIVGAKKYRFRVMDSEVKAFNDYKVTTSHNRVSMVMFLEPSGGYSCLPIEYLESTNQDISFNEICVYNDGCGSRLNSGDTIYKKTTRARYDFSIRSPRTQQFGIWMQHMAAAGKYFVLYRTDTGAKFWASFIVTSVSNGYSHNQDTITVSGYLADGLNPQK